MAQSGTDRTQQKGQKKRPYYGGGMPKGHKTAKTLEKEALRAELRQMVGEALRPMTEAQIANAQGVKYLVAREKQTGKFRKLSEAEAILTMGKDSDVEVIEVWEERPNVQAFTDLLNRTIDKPIEQVNVDAKGDFTIRWDSE